MMFGAEAAETFPHGFVGHILRGAFRQWFDNEPPNLDPVLRSREHDGSLAEIRCLFRIQCLRNRVGPDLEETAGAGRSRVLRRSAIDDERRLTVRVVASHKATKRVIKPGVAHLCTS